MTISTCSIEKEIIPIHEEVGRKGLPFRQRQVPVGFNFWSEEEEYERFLNKHDPEKNWKSPEEILDPESEEKTEQEVAEYYAEIDKEIESLETDDEPDDDYPLNWYHCYSEDAIDERYYEDEDYKEEENRRLMSTVPLTKLIRFDRMPSLEKFESPFDSRSRVDSRHVIKRKKHFPSKPMIGKKRNIRKGRKLKRIGLWNTDLWLWGEI